MNENSLAAGVTLVLLGLTLIVIGCSDSSGSRGGGPVPSDPDRFEDRAFAVPAAEHRPFIRWWWPGGAVEPAEIEAEIQMLADAGFGGVEVQAFSRQLSPSELDRGVLAWGTPQFFAALAAGREAPAAHGLAFDVTLGSAWPASAPTIDEARRGSSSSAASTSLDRQALRGLFLLQSRRWCRRGVRGRLRGRGSPATSRSGGADRGGRRSDARRRRPGRAVFVDSFELSAELPWTEGLLERFRETKGYDPAPYLPLLFRKGGEPEPAKLSGAPRPARFVAASGAEQRVREDYEDVRGEAFLEEHVVPLQEWATRRGVALRLQAHGGFAHLIDGYAAVDIPESEGLAGAGTYDFLKLAASRSSAAPVPFRAAASRRRAGRSSMRGSSTTG